jgi:preprotein translocase subunit SecA
VIGLRGYGQRDPLNEYKSEAFQLFEAMIQQLREGVTAQLMRVEVMQAPSPDDQQELPYMEAHKVDPFTGEDEMELADVSLVPSYGRNGSSTERAPNRDPKNPATWGKVGRNEACPCGSGKKFKHCHGSY